jgi:hypothetical protein
MSRDPLYAWNTPLIAPSKPKPAEPLWSVSMDRRQIDAELRGHGEYGWEFQLLHDREFYVGRRFDLREQAITHGEQVRQELGLRGWLGDSKAFARDMFAPHRRPASAIDSPTMARCACNQGWLCKEHPPWGGRTIAVPVPASNV